MKTGAENQPELNIYFTGRKSDNIFGATNQELSPEIIIIEKGAEMVPVIADPTRLPFVDASCYVHATNTDCNSAIRDELIRIDANHMPFDDIEPGNYRLPLSKRIKRAGHEVKRSIGQLLKHPDDGSRRVVNHFAANLFSRGYFDDEHEFHNYLELARRSNVKWLAIDSAIAVPTEFIATRILDFTVPPLLVYAMDDKAVAVALSSVAVALANGFIVKNAYLAARVGLVELPYILNEIRSGRMDKKRLFEYGTIYGGIAAANIVHVISYGLQPLIGIAHEHELATKTADVLKKGSK